MKRTNHQEHLSCPAPIAYQRYSSLCVHGILQRLASLEHRILRSRNLDGLARLRVAARTCSALLDLERTEADELDLLAGDESLLDGREECRHSFLSVFLRQACILSNLSYFWFSFSLISNLSYFGSEICGYV